MGIGFGLASVEGRSGEIVGDFCRGESMEYSGKVSVVLGEGHDGGWC